MCKRLILVLGFLAVAAAGCTGGGSSCVDDATARHHAKHPVSGQCLEFESSCDIPTSWADCTGGCTNECDPGSLRDEVSCECSPVCTTACDPPLLLDLATCGCVEACGPLDCEPGYAPAPDACVCRPIDVAATCSGDGECAAWQFCDFGSPPPPPGGGSGPGEAPGAGDAPLLPAPGTCQSNAGCTYDSECGLGLWCQGGFEDGPIDPGGGGEPRDGGSAPPSPGFVPEGEVPADRIPCAPDAGSDCGAPLAPGICTRGARGEIGATCFATSECGAGDVCPAEAGWCGAVPVPAPTPAVPGGGMALVACNSTCTPACYGDGGCPTGWSCNIPAASGGTCLLVSSGGAGGGDVPAGGGGVPVPPPCAGWCEPAAVPPSPPTDPPPPPA